MLTFFQPVTFDADANVEHYQAVLAGALPPDCGPVPSQEFIVKVSPLLTN